MKQIDHTEVTIKLMDEYTSKYLQENAELVKDTIKATLESINYCQCCKNVKGKHTHTFEVDLNTDKAKKYRCEQMAKVLKAPSKIYLYDGDNYIELKP